MPYTADDCSDLCWPYDGGPSQNTEDHERCEADLMDFSDPRKDYAYCACDCHYRPELPGFRATTAGRWITREEIMAERHDQGMNFSIIMGAAIMLVVFLSLYYGGYL